MSDRLRILLVNDSATVRAGLRLALAAYPDVEVVGEVADGGEAAAATERLRPSVVLMDAIMPRCDGYEATRNIMARAPTPVVMISAFEDAKQESVVLRALGAGALAIVELPPGPGAPSHKARWGGLVQLLRTMAGARVGPAPRASDRPPPPVTRTASRIKAIAVAASAGGPQAFATLLSALPRATMPPLLLVQHMAAGFSAGFAAWLASETSYPVVIARHGEALVAGTAYLAPEDQHLGVSPEGTAIVSGAPLVGGFRPSADFLLSSLARAYGSAGAAVVLTGMGSDGARGAVEVRAAGGVVIAESAESAVIDGMPRAVRERGAATTVLPLARIASYLSELSRSEQ